MSRRMKDALGASIKAEEQAVQERFDRADALFARQEPTAPTVQKEPRRVVRDSFTMPADDYACIDQLRQRCLQGGVSVNKSEVLRAGLAALSQMSDEELRAMVDRLEKVKTGRPQQAAQRV